MQRSHRNPYIVGSSGLTPHATYPTPTPARFLAGGYGMASTAPYGWVAGGIATSEAAVVPGLGVQESKAREQGIGTGAANTHTLDASNLGFKLLQKAGWQEGKGLGAKEQGIVNPVEAHQMRGNKGLGFVRPPPPPPKLSHHDNGYPGSSDVPKKGKKLKGPAQPQSLSTPASAKNTHKRKLKKQRQKARAYALPLPPPGPPVVWGQPSNWGELDNSLGVLPIGQQAGSSNYVLTPALQHSPPSQWGSALRQHHHTLAQQQQQPNPSTMSPSVAWGTATWTENISTPAATAAAAAAAAAAARTAGAQAGNNEPSNGAAAFLQSLCSRGDADGSSDHPIDLSEEPRHGGSKTEGHRHHESHRSGKGGTNIRPSHSLNAVHNGGIGKHTSHSKSSSKQSRNKDKHSDRAREARNHEDRPSSGHRRDQHKRHDQEHEASPHPPKVHRHGSKNHPSRRLDNDQRHDEGHRQKGQNTWHRPTTESVPLDFMEIDSPEQRDNQAGPTSVQAAAGECRNLCGSAALLHKKSQSTAEPQPAQTPDQQQQQQQKQQLQLQEQKLASSTDLRVSHGIAGSLAVHTLGVEIMVIGKQGELTLFSGGNRSSSMFDNINSVLQLIDVKLLCISSRNVSTLQIGNSGVGQENSSGLWQVLVGGRTLMMFSDGMVLPAKGPATAKRALLVQIGVARIQADKVKPKNAGVYGRGYMSDGSGRMKPGWWPGSADHGANGCLNAYIGVGTAVFSTMGFPEDQYHDGDRWELD